MPEKFQYICDLFVNNTNVNKLSKPTKNFFSFSKFATQIPNCHHQFTTQNLMTPSPKSNEITFEGLSIIL